jgi:F-type H+-transporting ATPase subunit gamma
MGSNNMQDIKRRIKSVTSTEHITNAMKLVSAAKLRKARANFETKAKNLHFITETIQSVFNNTTEIPRQYLLGDKEIRKTAYVIVTSNRGLCGSFNANVIKEAEREMAYAHEPPVIVAIGSKGRDYFEKRGYEIQSEYMAPPESISFLETHEISKPVVDLFNTEEIDEIRLVYTSYVSTLEQSVKNIRLLPFEAHHDPEVEEHRQEVEYEPSVGEVFNYLVPKYVEIQVYDAIVESATCEHAARRMAMESATDNAREMLDKLSLFYNRARQAAITDAIIEIVAGSEAQK